MAKVFKSRLGDKCDSDYERAILDDLTERGYSYLYESIERARFYYATPVPNGLCEGCGNTNSGIVQQRYRTLDLVLPNGIIVEVKGRFTAVNRTYMRHIKRCNQGADIRMMFMEDAWMTKDHKRRYSDFCRVNGIPCAFGDPRRNPGTKAYGVGGIPQEWIDE